MMKTTSLGSHRALSGQLYKYTNVVKGWQQRWFAVDPETGVLSYYLFDGPGDTVQPGQPARGEVGIYTVSLAFLIPYSTCFRSDNQYYQ